MNEQENETKGFKVTDRRKFTAAGDLRPEVAASHARAPEAASSPHPPASAKAAAGPRSRDEASATKPAASAVAAADNADVRTDAEFLSLVGWLATNALMQLGEMADPASGQRMENLEGAREFIDILAMLELKTRGNLSGEESKTLENVLYDLRMRFMAKANLLKT